MSNLLELGESLRTAKLSPVELTEACLDRIAKFNPVVNAFITVTAEVARSQARQAETEIRNGHWRGPLHGVPVALKDLIDTAGIATTAASRLYRDRVPAKSARVAQKLEEAGAILLGKQNLHEFAYGGSSIISAYGPVRNPWNPEVIAGGSSGGSAAAVALDLGYAAIGTDTAGSIREPAALCGVVGLKPTYGRVSAEGVVALSPSLDHVGPITRCVVDTAVLLSVIAGADSQSEANPRNAIEANFKDVIQARTRTLRVGVPRTFFLEDLDAEVEAGFEQAVSVIRGLTAHIEDLPLTPDTDRTLQAAESYALHQESIARSPELYEPETLRRLNTGAHISPEARHAGEAALQKARREIQSVFQQVDVLITPTTPMPAPRISDLQALPEKLRPVEIRLLRNTRPFNVWGLPALSLPCGFTREGLPIGLQIAGPPWREDLVLRLAYAYEQATEWRTRRPRLLDSPVTA